MPASTSNIVSSPFLQPTQQGLIKPPSVGGTNTAQFSPVQSNPSVQGLVNTGINAVGGLLGITSANNPKQTYLPSGTSTQPTAGGFTFPIAGGNQPQTPAPQAPAGGANTSLFALPGESFSQYEARVGGIQNAPPVTSAPPNNNQGAATGGASQQSTPQIGQSQAYTGQPAPSGFMWGPDGKLAPASGTTTNASGGLVSIPSNVATGGGTQTNFPSIVGGLAGTAAQPSAQFQNAENQYLQANQALQDLRTQGAQQNANILGSRTNLAEAGGEQGLLQSLEAGKEAALTGEMQAAQAAAQTATGQQGVQQAGLAAAGGLSQPQPASALGFYSPVSGQTSPYGGGAGGAFAAGQVQGNIAAGQQFQQTIAPAYNAAQSVLGNLNSFFEQNPDVNPSSSNLVNYANAWLRGQQLSDPKFTELTQYLNEFLNTLTPLIGAGGNVTDYKQSIVNAMLSPTASTSSIQQQLGNLFNNIATAKYGSIYGTGQSLAAPNANGTQSNTNTAAGINHW